MIKIIRNSMILFLSAVLCGCSHWLDSMDVRSETIYPPSYPADNPPPPKSNGTIYQSGHEVSLYTDPIANRVGDILTVRLEETTEGEKQAKTKATKVSTTNTNNGSGLGDGGIEPILLGGALHSLIFNTGTNLQFDGKGDTNQSNKLRGTISVTVTRVLSNGNMAIQGESWVTINQGREYIRLTGIVRPQDIGSDNIVSSQRIANARIAYSGGGLNGNATQGGFLTQLMYKFFPY